MKTRSPRLLSAVLGVSLALALPLAAEAAPKKKKKWARSHTHGQTFDRYPSATPRQRANAAAYERGDYYEQMSDAHPVGSPSWWYLKERETGGTWR